MYVCVLCVQCSCAAKKDQIQMSIVGIAENVSE